MAAGVSAKGHGHDHRRHAHDIFHAERGLANETCVAGCTTIYTTIYGEATLYNAPPPPSTSTPVPVSTSEAPATVPTPYVTTCATPGVYTFPATTLTVTEEVTAYGAASTTATPGTNTAGGVTTVVETSTTVVCPYATTTVSGGITTSTILTTSYVCPSAGTYTIAPVTTVVSLETVWVYPTVTSYAPGTYTQPEVVETVTETDYVFFCPYTSSAPAPPPPTYKASPPPAPTYKASPPPPPPSSPSKPSGPSGGGLGTSGKKWAVTYSPFTNTGDCKDASGVEVDLQAIAASGYTSVRIYASVCGGLDTVGAAAEKYGLKIIAGVFIDHTGIGGGSAAAEDVSALIAWGKWSLVELIVIGNEAVFNNYVSGSQLAGFISSSKSAFAAAGYTGPSTTTEPLDILQANKGALCGVLDLVGCNIHPYFNGDIYPSGAGAFVAGQLSLVDALCPGKTGINLETGWPYAGNANGVSIPSPANQLTALESIANAVGGKSVVLSFYDDLWKPAGSCGCETSFGISSIANEY
ncbi:glycoside hydrolase family 17 protein, partial [Stipitochalara longipes BDJ]